MAASDLTAIVRLHGSLHSCAPYNIRLLCAVSLETQTGGNSARCCRIVWGRGAVLVHRAGGGALTPPPLSNPKNPYAIVKKACPPMCLGTRRTSYGLRPHLVSGGVGRYVRIARRLAAIAVRPGADTFGLAVGGPPAKHRP